LYQELMKRLPSPVVALNHAAAVAMAEGAEAGLQRLHALTSLEDLQSYAPFFAARAELLRRVGRFEEALPDYERGLELAKNEPERRYLSRRLAEVRGLIGNPRDTSHDEKRPRPRATSACCLTAHNDWFLPRR
jgi:RNA polymerase sigma-70 factor (ECF subfamily)